MANWQDILRKAIAKSQAERMAEIKEAESGMDVSCEENNWAGNIDSEDLDKE
jgi:two-component SAPR family response regulator